MRKQGHYTMTKGSIHKKKVTNCKYICAQYHGTYFTQTLTDLKGESNNAIIVQDFNTTPGVREEARWVTGLGSQATRFLAQTSGFGSETPAPPVPAYHLEQGSRRHCPLQGLATITLYSDYICLNLNNSPVSQNQINFA